MVIRTQSIAEFLNEILIDYQLSMVGTARKSLSQGPEFFWQKYKLHTSLFAFDYTKTLVSYTSGTKKSRVVLLLSTLEN